MKSKRAQAATDLLLRCIGIQLEDAQSQLQSLRATVNRTNETIRSSREAILGTNTLVQPANSAKE